MTTRNILAKIILVITVGVTLTRAEFNVEIDTQAELELVGEIVNEKCTPFETFDNIICKPTTGIEDPGNSGYWSSCIESDCDLRIELTKVPGTQGVPLRIEILGFASGTGGQIQARYKKDSTSLPQNFGNPIKNTEGWTNTPIEISPTLGLTKESELFLRLASSPFDEMELVDKITLVYPDAATTTEATESTDAIASTSPTETTENTDTTTSSTEATENTDSTVSSTEATENTDTTVSSTEATENTDSTVSSTEATENTDTTVSSTEATENTDTTLSSTEATKNTDTTLSSTEGTENTDTTQTTTTTTTTTPTTTTTTTTTTPTTTTTTLTTTTRTTTTPTTTTRTTTTPPPPIDDVLNGTLPHSGWGVKDCLYREVVTDFPQRCRVNIPAGPRTGFWSSCGVDTCELMNTGRLTRTFEKPPTSVIINSYVSGDARIDVYVRILAGVGNNIHVGTIRNTAWSDTPFSLQGFGLTVNSEILFLPRATNYPDNVDIIEKITVKYSDPPLATTTTARTTTTEKPKDDDLLLILILVGVGIIIILVAITIGVILYRKNKKSHRRLTASSINSFDDQINNSYPPMPVKQSNYALQSSGSIQAPYGAAGPYQPPRQNYGPPGSDTQIFPRLVRRQ